MSRQDSRKANEAISPSLYRSLCIKSMAKHGKILQTYLQYSDCLPSWPQGPSPSKVLCCKDLQKAWAATPALGCGFSHDPTRCESFSSPSAGARDIRLKGRCQELHGHPCAKGQQIQRQNATCSRRSRHTNGARVNQLNCGQVTIDNTGNIH